MRQSYELHGTEGRANYRAEREEEQGNAYQTGGASSSFFTLTAYE